MINTKHLAGMALLFFMHGVCDAQELSLAACLDRLLSDRSFAALIDKVDLGSGKSTTSRRTEDTSFANDKERAIIERWAASRADCLKANSRYGNDVYRPPLQAFTLDAENKVMAAAVELYDKKITYADFNRRRQAIYDELREKTAQLGRQIQQQGMAHEQADRQAREREQMQREIDEAERQAVLARQQAEQAQESSARLSTRRSWPDAPRRYQPSPVTQARNCFRFGNRVTCTGG
ncbi:MAG: hypothetical protein JWN94_2973 [Betaproteobacteria bacterium]|nr:hypothetical protein [Betaproteobacteria bacterium]